jgi:hypothetical protein
MASAFKSISTILNVLQSVLALILAGVSMWFFVELKTFTDLRDRDRYLLDFEVYWPQILPWVFFVVCLIVIFVSMCGAYGAYTNKKPALVTYVTFLSIVTIGALAAGTLGLVCGDSKTTDDFMATTVSDAYSQMKLRKEVITAFGNIEKRFRCCGIKGSSDYTFVSIPESCCDKDELVACENSASRRRGCSEVAIPYTRMFIRYMSIGSIIVGVVCTISLIVAVMLAITARSKKDRLKSAAEKEPLKLPL